jgi:chromosome partitioning protein
VNALTSARSVLIPIQCEFYALEGLSQLLNTIRVVQQGLNRDLRVEGVLLTMFDRRLRLSQQVADEAREYFGDAVYESIIPRNVTLGESPSFGRPVILHDVQSRGAQAYLDLAQEVIRREPTSVG